MMDHSEAISSDPLGQLQVLAHDGHSLGVDGAEVGVFEQRNHVSFRGLLQR
jgi:hypothetical protein